MKIKLKVDNTRIKIGYDGKIESSRDPESPAEAAFCEINLDLLNEAYMAYKMFPSSLFANSNDISNIIEEPPNLNKNTYNKSVDTHGQIIANGHDIYNYVARFGAANYQIQTVMMLNGRLDHDKLKKAVRLSVDAEPVFGCRFTENEPPYWKRLDNLDKVVFCTFEDTNNLDQAIQKFLESPLDMDNDPMVKLKIISSGSQDTLCLKINHTCCDGTGTKEYLQLLSNIYSQIDQENGIYIPEPSIRTRNDQDRLFSALDIKDPDAAWNPLLDMPKTVWSFPWQQGSHNVARIAVCRLPFGHINTMYEYGRSKGSTVNDLLLTAFYRAMFEMSQPIIGIPMDISLTVDLRRYLPDQKTEAIRCFSGGFDTRLAQIANESFEGTLSRIVPLMKEVKNGRPGLQSAVGLEYVEKAKFYETLEYYKNLEKNLVYTNKCAPVLSNLGYISKSPLNFGKIAVTDAYIVPPAVSAPGILLCISTYNGIVTIAVSYYEAQVHSSQIEKLLNLYKKELIEGCRN